MTTTPKPVEGKKKKKKEGGNAGPDPATAEYIAGRISSDGREHKLADCQSVFVQLGEGGSRPGSRPKGPKAGAPIWGVCAHRPGSRTQLNPAQPKQADPGSAVPSAVRARELSQGRALRVEKEE